MKYTPAVFLFWISLLLVSADHSYAQWNHDITRELEIPDILDIESSPAHLYALSESEGLVVFRTYADSLQYLYTSTGMQRRGDQLTADIRFAYLFGNSRRLTIIEPTSVLGVYSSTVLPEVPIAGERIGNNLYVVMKNGSVGAISLETPESVDTPPAAVDPGRLDGRTVQHLATDSNRILYLLSDNYRIDIYRYSSSEEALIHQQAVQLDSELNRIFFTNQELLGTNSDGDIFLINSDGETEFLDNVESTVKKLAFWNDDLVVRNDKSELWVGRPDDGLTKWKEDPRAGNAFTVNNRQFYVSEFNSLFPVIRVNNSAESIADHMSANEFSIREIGNVTLPFPKPLLLPIETEGYSGKPNEITFSVESSLEGITIRGNSLFWQPGASDTGRHQILITATTPSGQNAQMQFTVDVKPFNSPPRFTPSRPRTLPAESLFEQTISAFDPDGTHPELIRYLGVDLPAGATLDEQTGLFSWTPSIRQVGTHTFRVIATDQFGAAASQDFEMRVVDVEEADETEQVNETDS